MCGKTKKETARSKQQNIFNLLLLQNTTPKIKTKLTKQIHTQIIQNNFTQKNYIIVNLIASYITSNHLSWSLKAFQNVNNPSTTLWNRVMWGQLRTENPRNSMVFFALMVGLAGARPNGFTYCYALSGCVHGGLVREGEIVHGRALRDGCVGDVSVVSSLVNLYGNPKSGGGGVDARKMFDELRERNTVCWNSLINGYVRRGDIDEAFHVFCEIPRREKNVVSWTTVVVGCVKSGRCREALRLFDQMRRERERDRDRDVDLELDQAALTAGLTACAKLADLKMGRWIHAYIERSVEPVFISLWNALIHMYASCGVINDAYGVFRRMPQKNTASWTTMIIAFARHGNTRAALSLFESMLTSEDDGVRPDGITFLGVLSACSHGGFVIEGRRIFNDMVELWGMEPGIKHYGCIVDLLSRAGFLQEAYNLIKTMPMQPNDAIWGAFLGGCRIHKDVELAARVALKFIDELDPERATGYLMLLAHVYADANRWQEAALLKRKMVDMGTRKPLGRSWIHDIKQKDSVQIRQEVSHLGGVNQQST